MFSTITYTLCLYRFYIEDPWYLVENLLQWLVVYTVHVYSAFIASQLLLVVCHEEGRLHTHTHTAILRPFVTGVRVPDETFTHSHLKCVVGVCHHSGFYEAWGRSIEASAPIIWLDTTPSGLLMLPPPSSLQFYVGCLSCRNP